MKHSLQVFIVSCKYWLVLAQLRALVPAWGTACPWPGITCTSTTICASSPILYIHTFCLILTCIHCSSPWTQYQYFQHYIHILHFIPNSCITAKEPPLPHSSTWLPPAIHPKIFCLLSSSKSFTTYINILHSTLHIICLTITQNILFAEPFKLLELVQLVGCLTLSHFWNCLSAVSDCWQEVSGWERTFPFFETQVKCGFRVGPVSQGWHMFQRISVFRIFVIVYFCCIFVGHFWNCSSAVSYCWQ